MPNPQANNAAAGGIVAPTSAQFASATWQLVPGLSNASLWSLQVCGASGGWDGAPCGAWLHATLAHLPSRPERRFEPVPGHLIFEPRWVGLVSRHLCSGSCCIVPAPLQPPILHVAAPCHYAAPDGDVNLGSGSDAAAATWYINIPPPPPPPPPTTVTVFAGNATHRVNPLFIGCHTGEGVGRCVLCGAWGCSGTGFSTPIINRRPRLHAGAARLVLPARLR